MHNFIKIIIPLIFIFTMVTPIHAQGKNAQSCLEKTAKGEALVIACLDGLKNVELDDEAIAKMQGILGDAYYEIDQFDAAIGVYKQLVIREPKNWIHNKDLGWSYWEIDQYENAIAAFDLSLALSPKSVTYRGKASSLRLLGRYELALETIHKALALAPKYRRNMLELTRIHNDMGNSELALETIDATILKNPESPYGWSLKGDVLMDLDDFSGAVKQYKMAVLINPEKRVFQNDLAWAYWDNEDFEEAISSFDAANAIENRANEMGGKASALSFLDRHEDALKLIHETLELDPSNVWNTNEKGWINFRAQNHKDAIAAFKETLMKDELYRYAWYGLARVYEDQENYAKALEAIVAALQIKQDVLYQGYHVYYLRTLERYGAANTAADMYLKDHPNNYNLITQKMWVMQGIDRIDEAVEFIQEKLANNPNDVSLITKFITFLEEEMRWDEAIVETQKLIKLNEADHQNYRDLAFYYQKLEQFDVCVKNAQIATELKTNWPWGYYYAAQCHLSIGDTAAAFAAIKASVLNGLDADSRNSFAADLLGAGAPILATRLGLMRIR